MKHLVITGVSSGIGRHAASYFTRAGWHVFGSVRREADALRLQQDLGERFTPLIFDVVDGDAVVVAAHAVRERLAGRTLDGLINNAGVSFSDPLLLQSVADFRQQLEINLVGTFAVTRAFAPLVGADRSLTGGKGRIINVSSQGGRLGAPFLGAYAAAKHGIEGFSESLRRELLLVGIKVVIVAPGAIVTPIWDKAEAMQVDHVAGTIWDAPFRAFVAWMIENGRKGARPDQVSKTLEEALTAHRPKLRYEVVRNRLLDGVLPAYLPRRIMDRLVGRQLGLLPELP